MMQQEKVVNHTGLGRLTTGPVRALGRLVAIYLALAATASAHPIPDIPLRAFFQADGSALFQVEIDPRCFDADPEMAPYLFLEEYLPMPEADRERLRAQALEYVRERVEIILAPGGAPQPAKVQPDWEFDFTTFRDGSLAAADDPVMLTGSWRVENLADFASYQLHAPPAGELSVLFLNYYEGDILSGIEVLFPGESSRVLDLTDLENAEIGDPDQTLIEGITSPGNWDTFRSFIRSGFVHVVPLGMDHILFVLGLFLLSRKWKPLLLQVSTFTVAHTITLGLAATGKVSVSSSVVEPIIAASIAVVALENILHPKYSHWRLLVVFVFGLVHGLGFAGALSELALPAAALVAGLLGFNVGVELGQLAVIVLAFIATVWLRDAALYRKFVVIPGSVAIAVMGVFWVIERTLL